RISLMNALPILGHRLYCQTTPPRFYESIISCLNAHGLHECDEKGSGRRVIVEKPFGHDFASARALNEAINEVFGEDSVYRIDHRSEERRVGKECRSRWWRYH